MVDRGGGGLIIYDIMPNPSSNKEIKKKKWKKWKKLYFKQSNEGEVCGQGKHQRGVGTMARLVESLQERRRDTRSVPPVPITGADLAVCWCVGLGGVAAGAEGTSLIFIPEMGHTARRSASPSATRRNSIALTGHPDRAGGRRGATASSGDVASASAFRA